MVKLNKIYTRTGDDSTTGLADGSRRPKHDPRISCYGDVDEANAAIGLARLHTKDDAILDAILQRLQNDLFDLGADLATPEDVAFEALRITPAQVVRLESEIDEINTKLAPLNSFILPGGNPAAAHLHLARTIIRRAERHLSAALGSSEESFTEAACHFINRASDLLFVAARFANNQGKDDVLWVPGSNR
ncbi:cob(I)yrinic acid a,c-diamide adenosyltransferase [Alphaproteobacteria bacterium]|nr:cob(I)yrinic acid a,c-diamide adenosyltransferase [Alphaproteobacteria bacterium]MDC0148378.1 cob(I)yrinic acid a,c-diamide adenosyltransferase [Alphaproteobacteria bacterium]MDC1241179.1 cob(I)yrinic acid a,c-diamide adenosyltransferase [bacterium]